MRWTKHEESLIHEVMKMSYEQGIEEGKRQAQEVIRGLAEKVNALKEKHND